LKEGPSRAGKPQDLFLKKNRGTLKPCLALGKRTGMKSAPAALRNEVMGIRYI
jgi:hypothetical protein